MPTPLEYMQFANGVYAASPNNKIDPPAGWSLRAWQPDQASGFSAGYYINNQGTEVVISYTGTNDFMDKVNWVTGVGLPLPQIFDAVAYYFQVKAANPNATITFTGHSLGGGLASLMAVFFDKQATVFDEAPFQPAAMSSFVLPAVASQMLSYGYSDSAFATYLLSAGLLALTRESNVTQYYVDGEALSYIRFSFNTLLGSDNQISIGNSNASAVERHSMALLTALQYSPALLEVVKKLPALVSVLLNESLFAAKTLDQDKDDLLRRLLRHQFGVTGKVQQDRMLDRFNADMLKLAQPGGLTMNDLSNANPDYTALSKTLMAFAMQMYYEDSANATNPNKQLFSDVSGGITFDMADVSTKFATAFQNHDKLNLADAKGFDLYFKKYLTNFQVQMPFTPQERQLILSVLPYMRDWYVQAGTSGLTTSDTLSRGAFMLGGCSQVANWSKSTINDLTWEIAA